MDNIQNCDSYIKSHITYILKILKIHTNMMQQ
jgi:hypothetical protein